MFACSNYNLQLLHHMLSFRRVRRWRVLINDSFLFCLGFWLLIIWFFRSCHQTLNLLLFLIHFWKKTLVELLISQSLILTPQRRLWLEFLIICLGSKDIFLVVVEWLEWSIKRLHLWFNSCRWLIVLCKKEVQITLMGVHFND